MHMQCYQCQQPLSPAEGLKVEEWERDFEAFERACHAWRGFDSLADVRIPDAVAPEPQGLTIDEEGYLSCPTSWSQPWCDRCTMLDFIYKVFYTYCLSPF